MWLLHSCSDTKVTLQNSDYNFPVEINVTSGLTLDLDSTFMQIKALSVDDGVLTVYSLASKNFINIFDCNNGAFINSYLTKGKAAGEILMANNVYYNHILNSVTISDHQSQKFVTYSIELKGKPKYTEKTLPDLGFKVCDLGNNTFLSLNKDPHSMYSLLQNDTTVATFFEYPADGHKITPSKAYAYQGFFIPNHNNTRFVYAGSNSDMLEIYELKGSELLKKASYGNSYPKYVDNNPENVFGVIFEKDLKLGFRDICFTDKYIYALYSGRDRTNYPDNYAYANEIYVADWDGNLVKKIILNTDVCKIGVEQNDKIIYAVEEAEDRCSIIRYNID